MTALEFIHAAEAAGIALSVAPDGKLRCQPQATAELRETLRANKAEVLALLRDPDRHGWELPPVEAIQAAVRRLR